MAKKENCDDVANTYNVTIYPPESKKEDRRLWNRSERRKWSFGLFTGCAILYSSRTLMPLCIVSVSQEMGWDKTESGSILSSFFWGYTMTQFLGGYLSDKIGGDVVLPIAACFWSLITFWTPQLAYVFTNKAYTLYLLVLSRVFLGMSQGFHYPSMTSLVSQKVNEEDRSLTYAFVAAGSYLGTLFTGSFGSYLQDHYGWQSTFYAIGLIGVLWMLCFKYCLAPQHRRKYVQTDGKFDDKYKEKIPVPWLKLFTKSAFWSLLVGHFCENNAFYILLSWLPTYFHENFPTAKGWVFNVVPWLVSIFSSVLSGVLADYLITKGHPVSYVRKFMETVALCGPAFFLMIIAYTSSYEASLFCVACALACCAFHSSGILVNPQDIAPKHAGAVFGMMNMVGAIPGFVGVYMAGHILEATKSWAAVFNQTGFVCIFGWIIYISFGSGKPII